MKEKKPRIVMVCDRTLPVDPNRVPQEHVGITYVNSVIKAGGLPFFIPMEYPTEDISLIREFFDGLLLIGGGDVDPKFYGGKEHFSVGGVWPVRDTLESKLARLAYDTGWPIFGICRGEQVMNVAAGGKLFSDIPDQVPHARFNHQQPGGTPRDALIHKVRITPGTLLHRIIEKDTIEVNSFHHEAVSEPGKNILISAYSEDDIIEGIEIPGHPFALGVQWHPECMQQYDDHARLFRAFVDACRK